MPASANAVLNKWADERVRTIADRITALSYVLDAYLAEYTSQGIAAAISSDGAANTFGANQGDGRALVTGTQIINQRAAILQLQTAMSTTLVSGVGATVKAINDPIQVNGSPR